MKLLSYCLQGILAHVYVGLVNAQCSNMVTRRDIASLSQAEWISTASVIQRMYNDGWFTYFASMHNQEFGNIHGTENFFPWHRRFLREVEEIGQRYDPNFAIPYWDELRDSHNPSGSLVLSYMYAGGNGFGGCIRDGLQEGWTLEFPSRHCLVRNYDLGSQLQPWYSPEYIYSLMQRHGDMHGLRENIEFTLHGSVHLGLGGDMATPYSPNDFVFFIHHANLDRLWAEWQNWGHTWVMDGRNSFGYPMDVDSPIAHYGDPVGTTMQLGAYRMCYRYDRIGSRQLGLGGERAGGALSLISKPPAKADGASVQANLASLPEPLLRKWFPRLANATRGSVAAPGKAGKTNSTLGAASPQVQGGGRALVYPAPLTSDWIAMHKYDPQRVERVMLEAREFVDDMNSANYLSPY